MGTLRIASGIVFFAGFASFGYEAAQSFLRDRDFRLMDTGEIWAMLHRDSLLALQPAVERHLSPWLWDPIILTVLTTPLTPILLVVAGFLFVVGSPRLRMR